MNFLRHTAIGAEYPLTEKINTSAMDLYKKFRQLDYRSLPLSPYGKNYYAYDLRKLYYMLESYAVLLLESVCKTGKKIENVSIIDHGAGLGIFSLLAKLSGAGTVIHQDINPDISNDAEIISHALGISIDHFVSGDTKDFVHYAREKKLKIDVLGSRNVIEHIYNINAFLAEVSQLPSDTLVLYISTTANIHNPLVRNYTRKIHRTYEIKGSPLEWGTKKYDADKSGIRIRERLIREYFPTLSKEELRKLSLLARGKLRGQIVSEVKNYVETGKLPEPIPDPTNTCDPYTGNWAEHLVPLKDYKKMAEANGFSFDYQCGFYNTHYPQKMLNLITPVLNLFIRLLGKKGLFLAPFMTLILEKKKN